MTEYHFDFPKFCLRDLFRGAPLPYAKLRMEEAAGLIQDWMHRNTSFDGSVQFNCEYDRDENPNGDLGFFRFSRELKDSSCQPQGEGV